MTTRAELDTDIRLARAISYHLWWYKRANEVLRLENAVLRRVLRLVLFLVSRKKAPDAD